MRGSAARVALFGLVACTTTGPADAPPVPAPVSAPAPAFPPFETIKRLPPVVANPSATSCFVAWPADNGEYAATFLFRTEDGGASFQAIGEVGGLASEAVALDGRIWLLQHYSGGAILPVIEYSDDGGLSWNAHSAVEAAVAGGVSQMNEVDHLSFRDRLVGKVRWNRDRWLETADGGDTWQVAAAEPAWTTTPPVEGPCRIDMTIRSEGGDFVASADRRILWRRTRTGRWERVPGSNRPVLLPGE